MRWGHEYSYVCKSDTLSKGFIFGEDKGVLDLVHKGQSRICELAISATQRLEMAVCLVVSVSCAQPALTDCKC